MMLAYELDGAAARLNPGVGRSLARGPGLLGRGGAADSVVWQAGLGIWDIDLFAGFWLHEAGEIDWLRGVLCDPAMTLLFERLAEPEEEDEPEEELFAKASMNTLSSDMRDEY